MKVCVLGAGVAGMTSAYFLARAGHDVTVVERNAGVGLETSYANGGQLSYSYVAPLAGPGVLPKVPPWLMKRDAPLRFSPRLDFFQWRFCLQFVLACNAAQSELTTSRLLRLSFYSRRLMHEMVRKEELDFDYVRNGKLVFYSDAASFRGCRGTMDYQRALGRAGALDRDGCVALRTRARTYCARDRRRHLHAERGRRRLLSFLHQPRTHSCARAPIPCIFELDTQVTGLQARRPGGISGGGNEPASIEADLYVVTLGAQSVFLLRPLGIDAPIYPLKGYSLTLPIASANAAPFVSITDHKRKVVYARLGEELRVAAWPTSRTTARSRSRAHRRAGAAGQAHVSRQRRFQRVKTWCGLRPATPKGTPVSVARVMPTCCSTSATARSGSRSRAAAARSSPTLPLARGGDLAGRFTLE